MASKALSDLSSILSGEKVFNRDIDSLILQASNGVTARTFFEFLKKVDASESGWEKDFSEGISELVNGEIGSLVAFDDGRWDGMEDVEEDDLLRSEKPVQYYLKLEFSCVDACFYQFNLFPSFDEPFVLSSARKRAEQFQLIRLDICHPKYLQIFIENLRVNNHLVGVHDSSEEEFVRSPSQAM